MKHLREIFEQNRNGIPMGIYSVCSAHPLVIEAAIEHAQEKKSPVLIEATANQVNQFGGYTGMMAANFKVFVEKIAQEKGFPSKNLLLGGDHLGPVCWCNEEASSAMEKSENLIRDYVAAGFKKIHLDCSMECADDVSPLSDEIIALRAARLCQVAEDEAIKQFGSSDILYVIGTEVPPPGGTSEDPDELEVTEPDHVRKTIAVHRQAFLKDGLDDAWQRVHAVVVQPGVEFSLTSVIQYDRDKAKELNNVISETDNFVFEAHSTDYQNPENYKSLVEDHFAILKVGPQLTFALREALYALADIERHLINGKQCSNLYETCEAEMLASPKYWERFYFGSEDEKKFLRHFSYSDRIRYYWTNRKISEAVDKLIHNLSKGPIPLPLISQYFPEYYLQISKGDLKGNPESLIKAKIRSVLESYSSACIRESL